MKTSVKENTLLKKHEFLFDYYISNEEGKETKKEGSYIIQEPSWDQITEAYKHIKDENGNLDYVTPGKTIFDLCCIEVDEEVIENNQLMLSICSQIAKRFVFSITGDIKKKIKAYKLNNDKLTIKEHCCLIEYYFKHKVTSLDEYAEYYNKLTWLSKKGIIDIKFN